MAVLPVAAQTQDDSVTNSGHLSARSPKSNNAKTTKKKRTGTSHSAAGRSKTASRAARAARTARLRQAFVASTDLRPMAQQLANMRTPEAYAGVTAYARKHTGEAALAAYLALGHAYLLDKRYTEAEESLRLAGKEADELADYVDYLGAEASHEAGDNAAAEGLLRGFAGRYPDSIFDDDAPVLEVNVLLGMNNATGAQRVLEAARAQGVEGRSDFELAGGQVEFALGQREAAARTFKQLLLTHPLSQDSQVARARLTEMGLEASLTPAELRSLGDAYYNAGRYGEAADKTFLIALELAEFFYLNERCAETPVILLDDVSHRIGRYPRAKTSRPHQLTRTVVYHDNEQERYFTIRFDGTTHEENSRYLRT